jgi:hypothetical protein
MSLQRSARLSRISLLQARTPLARTTGLSRSPWSRSVPLAGTGKGAARTRTPIKAVSDKRRAENRERAAMADRLWPDRREGTVMCGCGRPECSRPAADLNEILPRGRGGSITDEANVVPLSRECHDELTFRPASELGWAYRAGILKHDGLCCRGRKVCSRYAEDGAA